MIDLGFETPLRYASLLTHANLDTAALDLMITIPEQEYLYIMCDDAAMTRRRFDGVLERGKSLEEKSKRTSRN